jgi:hypothetical protein
VTPSTASAAIQTPDLRQVPGKDLLDELLGRHVPTFRGQPTVEPWASAGSVDLYREITARLTRLGEIRAAMVSGQIKLPVGPDEAPAACSRDVLADEIRDDAAAAAMPSKGPAGSYSVDAGTAGMLRVSFPRGLSAPALERLRRLEDARGCAADVEWIAEALRCIGLGWRSRLVLKQLEAPA